MKVAFQDIGNETATFEVSGTVKPGQAVKLSGNGTVAACAADGDIPVGVAVQVKNGCAAVQLKGYVRLPAASGLAVGLATISATKTGVVQSATTGRQVIVTDVANDMCGIIL